jgi:acylphosphatase
MLIQPVDRHMDSANNSTTLTPGTLHALATRRIHVTGIVQGVGFRYATQRHAQLLEICGWVRNCADGSVEALIQGTPQQLDLMQRWMRQGPRTARVRTLSAVPFETGQIFTQFEQHSDI